jgi:hypothetical protein
VYVALADRETCEFVTADARLVNALQRTSRSLSGLIRCLEFIMKKRQRHPRALDPARVGTYPAAACAGGGYVWDAVLEYRVWCHPERGAPDDFDGNDYFFAFANYPRALACSKNVKGAEEPLALVLQLEYIDEPSPGKYVHVKKRRITEWPVEFLSRPRRTKNTIPDFLLPNAPRNRLAILRGLVRKKRRAKKRGR